MKSAPATGRVRCAIYTRVSTDQGLAPLAAAITIGVLITIWLEVIDRASIG